MELLQVGPICGDAVIGEDVQSSGTSLGSQKDKSIEKKILCSNQYLHGWPIRGFCNLWNSFLNYKPFQPHFHRLLPLHHSKFPSRSVDRHLVYSETLQLDSIKVLNWLTLESRHHYCTAELQLYSHTVDTG